MQFADLKLPVATRLQLEFIGQDYKRYPCDAVLLGYRVGESVLVYLPKRPPQVTLRVGTKLEAKLALQSGLVAFDSFIDHLATHPYPYLHLAYPGTISLTPLRQAPRFPFNATLKAVAYSQLGVATNYVDGRFLDISVNGARVIFDKELASVAVRIDINARVMVAGTEQQLELKSELKRGFGRIDKEGEAGWHYGLAFDEPSPPQRLLLLALCHELQSGSRIFA
jgi:hypothetical protein